MLALPILAIGLSSLFLSKASAGRRIDFLRCFTRLLKLFCCGTELEELCAVTPRYFFDHHFA